jgi:hypothetical protein
MMKLFRKYLILTHRYLGIALSLLVIVWFVSGIVMMYAGGMPRLTPQLRLERLPPLDLSRIRLTPAEAADRAGDTGRTQLLTVLDRPAYRIGGTTVFADTGEILGDVGLEQSRGIAATFMNLPVERVRHARTLTRIDQWTLGQSRALPLHKFSVDDESGTELYVQPASGEVTTLTTRRSRTLAWIGTIPHWLYFAALRENQRLWYRIVVWTSAAACLLAVIGLVLAVIVIRRPAPFQLAKAVPYTGWLRWHYITGGVFGIFTVTWAFSGLLSMEPFGWTNATGLQVPRQALTGGPVDLSRFGNMDQAGWDRILGGRAIKEVEFSRIQDEHYYIVRLAADPSGPQRRERLHQPYYVTGRVESDRFVVNASTLAVRSAPFTTTSLVERLQAAIPTESIVESELLTEYDSYYYSRGRQTPLPVLRVKFNDPAETWVYVDPEMSQVLATIHRLNRVERWLYNGLHSLDFSFWYDKRPLWDIGMLTLLLGGLTTSCLGLIMGIKRLARRPVRVMSTQPTDAAPAAKWDRLPSTENPAG